LALINGSRKLSDGVAEWLAGEAPRFIHFDFCRAILAAGCPAPKLAQTATIWKILMCRTRVEIMGKVN
jgi:hypothetical protein